MNTSHLAANLRLRALTPALAVLALAFALLLSAGVAHAPAASGGLSTGGTQSTEKRAVGGGAKYKRIWRKVSRRNKRWARRTSECESGRNPRAIGGGGAYRGAFQFMKSTWRNSPKSPGGDPIRYPYRTQAVVAVALKKRDGAGHWPHCG